LAVILRLARSGYAFTHWYTVADGNGASYPAGDTFTIEGADVMLYADWRGSGSLDISFEPGTGANDSVLAMALQSDGKIVIGGEFTSYDGTDVEYVTRVETDGDLDTTSASDPGTNASSPLVVDIEQPGNQRIIIVGTFTSYNGINRGRIARIWR
jgi:hypothetical protein